MSDPDGDSKAEELRRLTARVVDGAQEGEAVEAYAAWSRRTTVRAYQSEVEEYTSAESFGVGVRVIADHRQGFAHTTVRTDAGVDAVLAEARDNARFGEPDEHQVLAQPDGTEPADLDLWHRAVLEFGEERKIDLALELEQRVLAGDPRIRSVRTAAYGDAASAAAISSTTGIDATSIGTFCHLSVSALASDGDETQIGGGVDVGREPGSLDLGVAAEDAVERSTRLLGAVKPDSARVRIVLEPRLAATLMAIVGGTLTGPAVQRGRSPFADRLGEAIAAPGFTLIDDPTDERSFGSDTYDGEGMACRRNRLIEDGVLQGFLFDAASGSRAGIGSTASAVRGYSSTPTAGTQALAIDPGKGTLDDFVAGVDDGLLVQSFVGLHSGVNPVSGDFSVGADGLRIRGGELAEPVREITVASTIQRMLLDVEQVGEDLEWLPSGAGGVSLVIPDVAMSGV